MAATIQDYLILMRPRQWAKNLLLFAGIVFAHHLSDRVLLGRVTLAFILFCLVSSAAYIINDWRDLDLDRAHPAKRRRPLAAGRIRPAPALTLSALLAVGAVTLSFALSVSFGATVVVYFVLTLAYSLYLKHIAILDIVLLAVGFVLRAMAGVFVIQTGRADIPLTPWFLICVFFLALFVSICKRRHELILIEDASQRRSVLESYSEKYFDQIISLSAGAAILTYTLYLVSVVETNSVSLHSVLMLSTILFVIFGIFRYLLLVYKHAAGGAPEELLLRDVPLVVNTVLWLICMILLHR